MSKLAFIALALSGCSFALVGGTPRHASTTTDCTESRAAPIVDAVVGAGLSIGGFAAIAAPNNCSYANQDDCTASNIGQGLRQTAGAILLLGGLVYAFSSFRGFSETGECRHAHGHGGNVSATIAR